MVTLEGLEDAVEARPAAVRSVRCPGIAERDNLAWRALDALEEEVGRRLPLAVSIDKRIPARAGLGGGSSDAAATLVAADRLHDLGLGAAGLERVAARVGADVPFLVRGGAQWAEGRGERLRAAAAPVFAAAIVHGGAGLATPSVYRAFDRLAPPPPDDAGDPPATFVALAAWTRNDLWPAALALDPGLGRAARALAAAGAASVLLCGSGACIAGLTRDVQAAAAIAERLPDRPAWVVTGPGAPRAIRAPRV
jgi:4-diphosphocytidyl-2-C-methyl-D-erythritol kinase